MVSFYRLPDATYEIESHTAPTGARVYTVSKDGEQLSFPSVTTVLSELPDPGIEDWKAAVGEQHANRISRIATAKGEDLHRAIEHYLQNGSLSGYKARPPTYPRLDKFKPSLDRIDGLYAQEIGLFSKQLQLAGRADAIGWFDGVLSVIDFKTSKNGVFEDALEKYYAQGTAYAIMLHELFGLVAKQIAILVSVEHGEDQVFIADPRSGYPKLKKALRLYEKRYNRESD